MIDRNRNERKALLQRIVHQKRLRPLGQIAKQGDFVFCDPASSCLGFNTSRRIYMMTRGAYSVPLNKRQTSDGLAMTLTRVIAIFQDSHTSLIAMSQPNISIFHRLLQGLQHPLVDRDSVFLQQLKCILYSFGWRLTRTSKKSLWSATARVTAELRPLAWKTRLTAPVRLCS